MKFLTLIKRELRESLIAMLVVGLVFFGMLALTLYAFVNRSADDYAYYAHDVKRGNLWELFHDSPLDEMVAPLIFTSVGLGVALAMLHFWMPRLTRTWGFLLHRSVSKPVILFSKLLAAVIVFIVAVGIPWAWSVHYVNQVKSTGFPAHPRVLWDGWFYVALGLTVYLATALSVVSTARWYTTRFVSLGFVIPILICAIPQSNLLASFSWLLLGALILLVQLAGTFLQREF